MRYKANWICGSELLSIVLERLLRADILPAARYKDIVHGTDKKPLTSGAPLDGCIIRNLMSSTFLH